MHFFLIFPTIFLKSSEKKNPTNIIIENTIKYDQICPFALYPSYAQKHIKQQHATPSVGKINLFTTLRSFPFTIIAMKMGI